MSMHIRDRHSAVERRGRLQPALRAWSKTRPYVCLCVLLFLGAITLSAQMDLSQVSGQPLPSPDLPVGTVTVRVIRGAVTNNVPNQDVEISVDGAPRHLTTDASGHVEVTGLKPGARVRAVTVVDGERIESKEFAIASTGIRVMLVAHDKSAAPSAAPVPGTISFGPESRVVAEMADDQLNVYYLMDIVNVGSAPVDTGGPVILDLPREAQRASLLADASKQATVNGARVIVTGPFAPGKTPVRVGFELPTSGGKAQVSSKIPAQLPQVIVIVAQVGGVDLVSPQIASKREVTDEGQRILVGTGPALQAGQTLSFDITGLPHHASWPPVLALMLAGSIMAAGVWGAVTARPRRKRA